MQWELFKFNRESNKNAESIIKSSSKLPFSKARSIAIIVIGAIMEH